jgi:hypothetical protein
MSVKLYTLTGANDQPYSSPIPGTVGRHRRHRVYGRLDCPAALLAIARGRGTNDRVSSPMKPLQSPQAIAPAGSAAPTGTSPGSKSRSDLTNQRATTSTP